MAPPDLARFEQVTGGGDIAPATQHDAWIWISGAESDVTWRSARDPVTLAGRQPRSDDALGA
jgi:deferrochelatase/peroxidase EfeB